MSTAYVTDVRGDVAAVAVWVRLSGAGGFAQAFEVFGRGEPGQEAFQVRAGQGLAGVAGRRRRGMR